MPRKPAKKTKEVKNAKQAAVERTKKHELIVQDLTAGLSTSDIAKRHGVTAATVCNVHNKNKDRIDEGINKRLQEREEAINKAFEEERERTARLIHKTGELLESALDQAIQLLESGDMVVKEVVTENTPEGQKSKEKRCPVTLQDVESLFKTVRSVLVQYQRTADNVQSS